MKANMHESIQIIGQEIEKCDSSCLIYRKKRQRFDSEHPGNIYYLKTGKVTVYRKSDNVLTNTLSGPAILGLSQLKGKEKTHYFRCDTDCDMWGLPFADASKLFDDKGLWKNAFELLTSITYQCYTRELMITQRNVRGIIIQYLKSIWEMNEDIKKKISIYTFILQRSNISRSSIYKTVCDLTDEGLIKVSRGRLIEYLIDCSIAR